MNISDLLIIYFAAGAPFGVYRITTLEDSPDTKAMLTVALHICLWPVYTVLFLRDRLLSKQTGDSSANIIDGIRIEIEQLAFADGTAAAIFDFREIFNRYAGLSEAANAEVPADLLHDFFELGSSENKTIASACIARRNREKLAFQQTSTRNEFVDLISDLSSYRPEVFDFAIRLASHVNDLDAVADLKAMSFQPAPPTNGSSISTSRPAHV